MSYVLTKSNLYWHYLSFNTIIVPTTRYEYITRNWSDSTISSLEIACLIYRLHIFFHECYVTDFQISNKLLLFFQVSEGIIVIVSFDFFVLLVFFILFSAGVFVLWVAVLSKLFLSSFYDSLNLFYLTRWSPSSITVVSEIDWYTYL